MDIWVTTGCRGFRWLFGSPAPQSHTQQQMQEKTNIVAEHSASLGLNIHRGKNRFLKWIQYSLSHIGRGSSEEVDHFAYLGSVADTQGGTETDVKARIGKAMVAFLQMRIIFGIPTSFRLKKKQDQNLQYKCQGCSSLEGRDMEDQSLHKIVLLLLSTTKWEFWWTTATNWDITAFMVKHWRGCSILRPMSHPPWILGGCILLIGHPSPEIAISEQ